MQLLINRKITGLPGGQHSQFLDQKAAKTKFELNPPYLWLTVLIILFAAFCTFGVGVFIYALAKDRLPGVEKIAWIAIVVLSLFGLYCWVNGVKRLLLIIGRDRYHLWLLPGALVERRGKTVTVIPVDRIQYAYEKMGYQGSPGGHNVIYIDQTGRERWHALFDRFTDKNITKRINKFFGKSPPPEEYD